MSFKVKAFCFVFGILVLAYVFGGCGRNTSQAVPQDGEVQTQQQ